MNTRRQLLGTLGAITIAGCTSQGETQKSDTQETVNTDELDLAIPLDGLGNYEEAVRTADPLEEASKDARGDPMLTGNDIQNMLDGADTVEEEAQYLAENVHTSFLHSTMQKYHQHKTDSQNTVVANINWSFTSDSEPIIEYHTVQNGNLQGNPIIADANTTITTHKPSQQEPDYLAALRTDDRYTSTVPQDHDAFEDLIDELVDDNEDYTRREARETTFNKWSNALFGVESEPNVIPYDGESSNVVFDGLYHGENTEAVVQLNQQYAESGLADTDEVVSAQYTGEGWEFEVQEDYEMGDKLPSHQ